MEKCRIKSWTRAFTNETKICKHGTIYFKKKTNQIYHVQRVHPSVALGVHAADGGHTLKMLNLIFLLKYRVFVIQLAIRK